MRASRDPSGTLTVTNVESLVRTLRAGFVVAMAAVWFAPIPPLQRAGWALVAGIFVLALTAADERSLFVFDAQGEVLRWSKVTPFRRSSGVVPFSAVTGLSIERDFRLGARRGGARRLVIHTASGPLPVTSSFTGIGDAAERTGRVIQTYLAEAQPHRTVDLVTP